jgi:hypothetical protein
VAPSQDKAADIMTHFEHAVVGPNARLRDPQISSALDRLRDPQPSSLAWNHINDLAGAKMFKGVKAVMCCTIIDDGPACAVARKYLFQDHIRDDAWNVLMVKYNHCAGSHAIVVRKTTEVDVSIEVKELDDENEFKEGFCKVEVRDDKGECVFARLASRDSVFKITSIANSVKATLATKNLATCQSKVNWFFEGVKVNVSKHIIKAKKGRCGGGSLGGFLGIAEVALRKEGCSAKDVKVALSQVRGSGSQSSAFSRQSSAVP